MKAFLPAHHTGKPANHSHTSYAGLVFLLIITTIVVSALGAIAQAGEGDTSGGDASGIFATVPGKIPRAPTITAPASGAQVNRVPTNVSGSCEIGFAVKVYKNDIVAGAATCSASGTYSVPIDLFFGNNSLVTQAFNEQDESSPRSATVGVQFAPLSGSLASQFQQFKASSAIANQLFIKADTFHRAVGGGDISWPLELVGGTAPYAVSVAWGDGKNDLYSRGASGTFSIGHRYDQSSQNYDVIVKASDAAAHNAYVQLASVGAAPQSTPLTSPKPLGYTIIWPLLGVAFTVVVAFWLGERHETRILARRLAT